MTPHIETSLWIFLGLVALAILCGCIMALVIGRRAKRKWQKVVMNMNLRTNNSMTPSQREMYLDAMAQDLDNATVLMNAVAMRLACLHDDEVTDAAREVIAQLKFLKGRTEHHLSKERKPC